MSAAPWVCAKVDLVLGVKGAGVLASPSVSNCVKNGFMSDEALPDRSVVQSVVVGVAMAAAGQVPGLGIVLGGVQAAIETRRQEVQDEYLALLAARVRWLEEQNGDIRFNPADPDFYAAVNRLLRAAHESADDEKRRLLAEAAAGIGAGHAATPEQQDRFIDWVARLRPWHIRLLVAYDNPAGWIASHGGDPEKYERVTFASLHTFIRDDIAGGYGELKGHLTDLVAELDREGLLTLPVQTLEATTTGSALTQIRTTEQGRRLLEFLGAGQRSTGEFGNEPF
jgi:hypothetical protein